MFCHRLFAVSMTYHVRATVMLHAGLAALYDAVRWTWERDNHMTAMMALYDVLMDMEPEEN